MIVYDTVLIHSDLQIKTWFLVSIATLVWPDGVGILMTVMKTL